MGDELITKLQQIDNDVQNNLKPENLKEGVNCLNVIGSVKDLDNYVVTNISQSNVDITDRVEFIDLLKKSPDIDLNNVRNISQFFQYSSHLVSVGNLYNTQLVNNAANMFNGCYNLVNVPNFNTINVDNTVRMFSNCYSLTNIPNLDLSNVTNASYMFYNCAIYNIPNLNYCNIKNGVYMFADCQNITYVENLYLPNATVVSSMFSNCRNLQNVNNINMPKLSTASNIFNGCYNIKS